MRTTGRAPNATESAGVRGRKPGAKVRLTAKFWPDNLPVRLIIQAVAWPDHGRKFFRTRWPIRTIGRQPTGDRGNDRGAVGQAFVHFAPRSSMSGLMLSVAINFLVIVIFFMAAILMAVGMLGIR
jgi:hypothetical protein